MSLRQRVLHELKEIGIVSLYFFVCFVIFLTLKKLLLEDYNVSVYVFHAALIGALVVAKVVVLLENTAFGRLFRNGRLILHVIWRTLAYTAVVFLVILAEQAVEVYLDQGSVASFWQNLWTRKEFDHALALNLCVALSFLVYNTLRELDRRLGPGTLRRLVLSRHKVAADG